MQQPFTARKQLPEPHRHKTQHMGEIQLLDQQGLDEAKIIYAGMPGREVLNAFREVRTKLFQKFKNENFVLMVSSVCDFGGSTFTGVNLAAAIALDREKTAIVVDCNLYNPKLNSFLGDQIEYGLGDYLGDPTLSVEDIIYATGVPRLRIVPAGGEHEPGLELYASENMSKFIGELKERYPDRYIILDAPPIITSADTRILQEKCDGCLLVVPYGKVSKKQVLSAIDAMDQERLVGLIHNNF